MLSIAIDSAKGVPIKFDWEATSEEFQCLCNRLEEMAADEGLDPTDFAHTAIHMTATRGELNDEAQRRGQRVWIVYAVLRYVADNVDLSEMVDHAGVITGPLTVFDLAEHQHIKATMRVGDKRIEMAVTGAPLLDS
jgi:hypothetical protein